MMTIEKLAALFPDLDVTEVTMWVERHWVQPDFGEGGEWEFREIDVARVRLIRELTHDLAVEEETMPLVLSLLDQIYELRCTFKEMLKAVEGQPPEVRSSLLEALERIERKER